MSLIVEIIVRRTDPPTEVLHVTFDARARYKYVNGWIPCSEDGYILQGFDFDPKIEDTTKQEYGYVEG